MSGSIRVGIGGWSYERWRGVFYPAGLPNDRELEFASRAVNTIEINATKYSTFKPDTWRRWRDETPDDFVFAIKASRFCTDRDALATAGKSIRAFLHQGIAELGGKLGPINWQFEETKLFDPEDLRAFLELLPQDVAGLPLRHAVEPQHSSFDTPDFYGLLSDHPIGVVRTDAGYLRSYCQTSSFTYARIKSSSEDLERGFTEPQLNHFARQAVEWSERGDVFLYFIDGAKVRNPAAAQEVLRGVESAR